MASEQENLTAWLTDPLRTILVRLGQNTITAPVPDLDLDNFVESTFPGYAPVAINPTSVVWDETNEQDAAQAIFKVVFSGVGIIAAEYVTCYVIQQTYNGGPAILLRSVWSDPPYLMDSDGDLLFDVRILSLNLD